MYENLLADGKELNGIRRKRNHPYEYLKVLPEEQSNKEKEGWTLYKELKKEVKLRLLDDILQSVQTAHYFRHKTA